MNSPESPPVFFRQLLALTFFVCLHLHFTLPAFAQKKQEDRVYDGVQTPAEMPGGLEGFQKYLSDNLVYPTSSIRNKTQGTVVVSFIVEKNGSVSNVEVKSGLDQACNNESVRVISKSPKWKPARHDGQVVRQRLTVPIQFKMPGSAADTAKTSTADSTQSGDLKRVDPEQPARPENGQEAFFKYLQENQKYPAKARKNQVQGKVMVEFIVEKDGTLTNLKVIKRLGNGLDEEALRLINKGPKWLPAEYKGEPIRQKMILPVIFQL
jgi:protein TonB